MSLVQVNNFDLIPDSVLQSDNKNIQGAKELVPYYPQQGSANYGYNNSAAQKVMTFEIGSDTSDLKGQDSYLSFDVKLAVGTTGAVVAGDGTCFFNRMRVLTMAGVPLIDQQELALSAWIKNVHTIGDGPKAAKWPSLMDQLNISDSASLKITSTAQHVVVPLPTGFWHQIRSLCLPITGNIRIVFDLAPDNQAFSLFNASTDRYRIDNPVIHAHLVPLTPDFLERTRALAAAGGYLLNYSDEYFLRAPCTATSNTVNIPYAMKSVRGVVGIAKLDTEDDTYNLSYLKGVSPLGGLSSLQIRQGSNSYPSSAITATEEVYDEAQKFFKVYGDIDGTNQITRANFTQAVNTSTDQKLSSKFSFAIDTAQAGVNTGLSTINGGLNVLYNVVTATSNTSLLLFSVYDKIAVVRNPNSVTLDW